MLGLSDDETEAVPEVVGDEIESEPAAETPPVSEENSVENAAGSYKN